MRIRVLVLLTLPSWYWQEALFKNKLRYELNHIYIFNAKNILFSRMYVCFVLYCRILWHCGDLLKFPFLNSFQLDVPLLLSWLEVIQVTCWFLIMSWKQLGAFPLSANQTVRTTFSLGGGELHTFTLCTDSIETFLLSSFLFKLILKELKNSFALVY